MLAPLPAAGSIRLHILNLADTAPAGVRHVNRTGRLFGIEDIHRCLLAVSDKVFFSFAVGGADAAATEDADRLSFRVAMPTFHSLWSDAERSRSATRRH